jgi:uncharacterized protein
MGVVTSRIIMLDVLRALALSGILLIHHIEKFNLYLKPEGMPPWLVHLDAYLWQQIFFFMSGKAFALFSLLFGFSYFIMYRNAIARGEDYLFRHIWRMVLLFGFGLFHALFYRGDILTTYAMLGILLVFTRFLSAKAILFIACVLLLNPLFIYSAGQYLLTGEVMNWRLDYSGFKMNPKTISVGILELMGLNIQYGVFDEWRWSWNVGRIPTILGLFYLGCYFAKIEAFTRASLSYWARVLIGCLALWFVLHLLQKVWVSHIEVKSTMRFYNRAMRGLIDTAMMLSMLSSFIMLWRINAVSMTSGLLISFGRMGLTNYIAMSIIGAFIYYGWGLGWYKYFGATASLLMGCTVLYGQMKVSDWWLRRYKQGPLEFLWRRLTWIGRKSLN